MRWWGLINGGEVRFSICSRCLPTPGRGWAQSRGRGGGRGTLIGIPPASPCSLFLSSGQHPVARRCSIPGLSVLSADNKKQARLTGVCWFSASPGLLRLSRSKVGRNLCFSARRGRALKPGRGALLAPECSRARVKRESGGGGFRLWLFQPPPPVYQR